MSLLRPYHSEPTLELNASSPARAEGPRLALPYNLIASHSEPTIRKKTHPLLEEDLECSKNGYNYAELLLAAETFENIVMEGTLVGANIRRRLSLLGQSSGAKEAGKMNSRVLRLVYGAMKCMYDLH